MESQGRPRGYSWRSSTAMVMITAVLGLFSESFLYAFLVPILKFMLETRLHLDPSHSQNLTTALLASHGFAALISAPIIGHFADKAPNKRTPLLFSLLLSALSTLLIAFTPSVLALFIGRFIQGCCGSGGWILCFATLADNIHEKHVGKAIGLAMSFVTVALVAAPVASGALLDALGYWATWSVPLILLSMGLIARLLLIECCDGPNSKLTHSSECGKCDGKWVEEQDERASLLSSSPYSYPSYQSEEISKPKMVTAIGFYKIMLRERCVLGGLINILVLYTMIAGFDTTLPLFLQNVVGWSTTQVGLAFLAIQLPDMLFSPLMGWLRDRVGLKYPVAVGWVLLAPTLWLLGLPGAMWSNWPVSKSTAQAIVVSSVLGFGLLSPLVRGAGHLQLIVAARKLEEKNPDIWGGDGSNSRMASLGEISFSLGLTLGPLLTGLLTETVGYYYMNCILATTSLFVAIISWYSLS